MTLINSHIEDKYPHKISTAQYSEREELFFCKMGIPSKKEGIELHYYVWGNSSIDCQEKAIRLAKILTPQKKEPQPKQLNKVQIWLNKLFGKSDYGQQ